MIRALTAAALLSALALLTGCLRPGEAWTAADRAVGVATAAGVTLTVDDGAAAIRAFDGASATLWAGAPTFTATLSGAPAEPVTLTLRNVLADAVLTVDGAPATLLDQPVPTEQVWRFTPAAASTRLALAPPDADDLGEWRFAVLSDVQRALPEVADIWAVIEADPTIRFVASAGDLVNRGDAAELAEFQDRLRALAVPLYATPGNHERGVDAGAWHRAFGRGSHHFVFRGVHFSFADSGAATIDPPVYGWLEGWLDAGRDAAHVFLSHVPPLDPVGARHGAFRSRREAAKLIALLGHGRVDAAFHGHVHSYYAYVSGGVPTYISGGGGAIAERLDGIGRHFLVVDADAAAVRQVAVVRVD